MRHRKRGAFALALGLVAATAALAHDGVKNEAVKARMMSMGTIVENTKLLGQMAKGAKPFDAATAQAAAAAISAEAARVPTLFEANETDPKSEALPEIWSDWATFTARNDALVAAAAGLAMASDLAALQGGMAALGKSCKGCHSTFRMKK